MTRSTSDPTAPRPVPLEDLCITWRPAPLFHTADGPKTMTIRGRELPVVLQALSTLNPGGDWSHFADAEDLALESVALADLVELLGEAEIGDCGANINIVLWYLSRRIRELAALTRAVAGQGHDIATGNVAEEIAVTLAPAASDGAR